MRINVTIVDMRSMLLKYGNNAFTPYGAFILASYLDGYMAEDAIFNVMDTCCTYTEYLSPVDFAEQYWIDYKDFFKIKSQDSQRDIDHIILSWIAKRTPALLWSSGMIVKNIIPE